MNTKMFLKITENIADLSVISKNNLIISGLGVTAEDIKKFFKKTPIKRSRAIIDMKKNIAKTIIENHNKKYRLNKYLIYSLTDIANLLGLKNHATILSYFKNEKSDDNLSIFVRENFIRWIEEKKYPIPFQHTDRKDNYVLIKESELDNLVFTKSNKIKSEYFHKFINIEQKEHFISD